MKDPVFRLVAKKFTHLKAYSQCWLHSYTRTCSHWGQQVFHHWLQESVLRPTELASFGTTYAGHFLPSIIHFGLQPQHCSVLCSTFYPFSEVTSLAEPSSPRMPRTTNSSLSSVWSKVVLKVRVISWQVMTSDTCIALFSSILHHETFKACAFS